MPFPRKPGQLSTDSSSTNCSVCVCGGGLGWRVRKKVAVVGNPSCCLSFYELRGPPALELALPGIILLRGTTLGLLPAAPGEHIHTHEQRHG